MVSVPPKALSSRQNDPEFDYEAFNPNLRVFLDGVRQGNVFAYNKTQGWVKRYKVDEQGKLIFVLGDLVEEKLKGVVSVTYGDS